MNSLIALRKQLHLYPELAHQEKHTAQIILDFFKDLCPDKTLKNIGGSGLVFIFSGKKPGPGVLLRAELDAVPIHEKNSFVYRSKNAGIAHMCGHDGHMAILCAVGKRLSEQRPESGQVVLLFQPAEETGQGAAAVINDKKFLQICPDYAFALHNLPGFELGKIVLKSGPFASASLGISIKLVGLSAHAAQPETGKSPTAAMVRIIESLFCPPAHILDHSSHPIITVVGAHLGAKTFGTAPGQAEIWATLRAETDEYIKTLLKYAKDTAENVAAHESLKITITVEDVFPATINSKSAAAILHSITPKPKLVKPDKAFRWSEDFGHFSKICETAMFGLGAGRKCTNLHNPDYDFPDELIETGANLFIKIIKAVSR
jgi:amidohydrolase